MRKTVISFAILFISAIAFSQVNISCDQVKKENENLKSTISALKQDTAYLNEKLRYFSATPDNGMQISSFTSSYDIKFLSCKGDRGAQTVRIDFVVHHKKVHQGFYVSKYSEAYDEIGNVFEIKDGAVGNGVLGMYQMIPTDVDYKCFVIFRGIIGGTDRLKLILLPAGTKDNDGGNNEIDGKIEMRNVKINWL